MGYYLVHITYPILFAAVLARQLCLPIPANLFLLSAGALAGSGKLAYSGILLAAVAGCLIADYVWFEAGRLGGNRVLRLICALSRDPSLCIRNGRTTFQKRVVRILYVAKFIPGLDAITPPLAGMLGTSTTSFLAHDAVGATLWATAYIGCGYLFAEKLHEVVGHISAVANALILIFGIPLLLLFVWKLVIVVRMIRVLRALQLTPEDLKSRLDSGRKIGIIDLLRFEDDPEDEPGIPGAVRLNPLELRRKKQFHMPDDVSVVVYCRSSNSFASARVAAVMRSHGVQRVQVLEGGLEAWKACGYPLTATLADPLTELSRLGVEVDPPWQPLPAREHSTRRGKPKK